MEIGVVRHATFLRRLGRALIEPMAAEIARRAAHFEPDLVLAIGGFHTPLEVLEALRDRNVRAPIVGWVGDAFGPEAATVAALYDLVAHTDSALEARHRGLGFSSPAVWLPHAANPHRVAPRKTRVNDIVFVAAASPERRRIVESLAEPIAVYGPGWSGPPGPGRVRGGRVPHTRLGAIYAGHAASLNIRNAVNVVAGLNQRNFDPYLFGAAVIGDNQPDLARCFELTTETLVFASTAELDVLHARVKHDPAWITSVAVRGLARIRAEHTFAHRLATLTKVLD